ncbi:MAG: O-antigen ligase family protein [Ignavibacteriales bacterium]
MQDLYYILGIVIVLIAGAAVAWVTVKKFELAVFFIALSPWISAIFFTNTPSFDYEADAGIGSYLRVGLILLMGAIGIFKYIKMLPVNQGRVPVHFMLLGIFLLLAVASTGYSIDQNFTFIRSISFIAIAGFLLGLDSWLEGQEQFDKALNVLFYFVAFCTIVNIIAMAVMPGRVWWWEAEERFIGLWDQPNTTGAFFMVSYPVLLWKFPRTESIYGKVFIVGISIAILFLHFLTGSRTSILLACAGLILWFLVQKKYIRTGLIVTASVMFLLLLVQFKPQGFQREGAESITDLTGRDEFWQGAKILISEKPLAGYGYSVEGKVWEDARFYNEKNSLWTGNSRNSLHNGYISVAIGVGVIALLLWIAILLIPLWHAVYLPAGSYKAFFISILVIILLSNFVETAITGGNSIDSAFFWIVWVMAGKAFKVEFNDTNNLA